MDLVSMRAAFRRRSAGLASSLTDGEVDGALNRMYQHRLPDRVPGQLTDGVWTFTQLAGVATQAFPSFVWGVRPGIRIGSIFLEWFTRRQEFEARYDPTDTAMGTPAAVLVEGRALQLHPIPDAEVVVAAPARLYPTNAAGDALATLPATGIAHDGHANAVVWLGVQEFADDHDLGVLAERARMRADGLISLLVGRELARSRERRTIGMRSF